ncbi:MAG TPA: efflux transporter outer membrane subunit [Gammaproteobacteria bacterium]|nr:efflux transporter outer membrane subunit [Gammaproteobacteria bacterium]
MRKPFILPLLLAGLLAGCATMAPKYERPESPTADAYPVATTGQGDIRAVDIGWREFFQDARLQTLIEAALENNRDLRSAVLNIEAARASYNIQSSERLPSITGEGSFSRARTSESISRTGEANTFSEYRVALGVSAFELDFFGRVRSLSEAALAQYLATEEAARSAQISLVAEVARAYLAERAFAEQLDLARRTVQAREASYQLAQQRFEAGAASALDLRQVETLLEQARVSAAALARQQAQAVNALTVLVGTPLQQLSLPAPLTLSDQRLLADIPAGLPSDLLTLRPDIRSAEQQLISANANIGAARAAFFPRISLTGSIGTVSAELSDLFGSGTGTWLFMPQISLPIFDGGRNRANLALSEVRKSQAVVAYERTIQVAFREVADALVARDNLEEQVAAQERLRAAQAERLALAEQRYESGVASYLDVLDAQRELFSAEQDLVQTRQLRLTNSIDFYRALGGGLREQSPPVVVEPLATND